MIVQQQKVAEFRQHPIIQLAVQARDYDPTKMADARSEINDYDPEKFKAIPSQETETISEDVLLEMANRENQGMVPGKKVPPTPYSTRTHTNIHLAFMGSDQFKQSLSEDIMNNFVYHILGEEKAQNQRNQNPPQQANMMPQQPQQMPGNVSQGVMASEAKASMPGRMVGQEQPL